MRYSSLLLILIPFTGRVSALVRSESVPTATVPLDSSTASTLNLGDPAPLSVGFADISDLSNAERMLRRLPLKKPDHLFGEEELKGE